MVRPFTFLRCSALLAVIVLCAATITASAAPAVASAPDCSAGQHCGLLADGDYSNLVIGTLSYVGTAQDMKRVFHWAKTHDYWQSLPDAVAPYLQDITLVTIKLPDSQADEPVTVFMQRSEYRSARYAVGDLVRYSPHDLAHETPEGNAHDLALYHRLSGCVATLCRQGDTTCFKRYRQGVFTKTHGQPVNLDTGKSMPQAVRIDPESLLPVRQHDAK